MKIIYAATSPALRRWFWWLLLLNIGFILFMKFYLYPLGPGEIVRFEIARSAAKAEQITQLWKSNGKLEKAIESIYIDYGFIILYTAGFAVACAFFSRLTGHEILIKAGKGLSYLLGIAGICDVVENISMLKSLSGTIHQWNVTFSYDMAATKFSIIIVSALFILVCLVFWLSNIIMSKNKAFFW